MKELNMKKVLKKVKGTKEVYGVDIYNLTSYKYLITNNILGFTFEVADDKNYLTEISEDKFKNILKEYIFFRNKKKAQRFIKKTEKVQAYKNKKATINRLLSNDGDYPPFDISKEDIII